MKYTVMVVDDDEICLMMHAQVILNSGLDQTPIPFNSASKALTFLKTLHETDVPVLVFLDINMPELDGWEFLDLLHQGDFREGIYVVVVSSSVDMRDKERAAAYAKVIEFIEKPMTESPLKTLSSKIPGF